VTRRGATGLAGILLLDKPAGPTSHDVVAAVRRATGEGRIGHAGTLDPAATGLLVVLVGPYTRLEPFLSSARKTYEAIISFGTSTDTDDAEGEVCVTEPVPDGVFEPARARELLAGFLGPSEQRPPIYSAIKMGGRVAHRAARGGDALVLEERPIEVYAAELLDVDAQACAWSVRFTVSKGTYVRALARDIGRSAGTVAHLGGLRRTASGSLSVDDAHTLAEVEDAGASGVDALFADPLQALGLPVVEAPAADVFNGRPIAAGEDRAAGDGDLAAVTVDGRLAAVYRRVADTLVPEAVLGRRGSS
jgi:tRNA pseudouridine55 synthase